MLRILLLPLLDSGFYDRLLGEKILATLLLPNIMGISGLFSQLLPLFLLDNPVLMAIAFLLKCIIQMAQAIILKYKSKIKIGIIRFRTFYLTSMQYQLNRIFGKRVNRILNNRVDEKGVIVDSCNLLISCPSFLEHLYQQISN